MGERKISPQELYRLRQAALDAERKALRAQAAQLLVREMALELERRYGLLATDTMLDIHTGRIK